MEPPQSLEQHINCSPLAERLSLGNCHERAKPRRHLPDQSCPTISALPCPRPIPSTACQPLRRLPSCRSCCPSDTSGNTPVASMLSTGGPFGPAIAPVESSPGRSPFIVEEVPEPSTTFYVLCFSLPLENHRRRICLVIFRSFQWKFIVV